MGGIVQQNRAQDGLSAKTSAGSPVIARQVGIVAISKSLGRWGRVVVVKILIAEVENEV